MEPGGIADEMRATAAANPDVMKLEQIGTSTLGKPILVIKMTADARNTPDGTRPAILFSAINHAREWIAAEKGRRLPVWFAEHKNDPKIQEIIQTASCGSCRSRTRTATTSPSPAALGAAQARVRLPQPSRRRQPLLAQDAARQQRQRHLRHNQDGVDPNRNYPAKRGIDEEGATTLLRARPTAARTRSPSPRTSPSTASSAASSSRPTSTTTPRPAAADAGVLHDGLLPPDSTLFDAITGTDGDEAVFPYRSQHSSDLYESNGDTIDNGYMNYGIIGWTPEMDTCTTLRRRRGCNQFASPGRRGEDQGGLRQEPRVRAQRGELAAEPRAPEELRQRSEPLPDQADRRTSSSTASTSPTAARRSSRRRSARSSARPTSPSASSARRQRTDRDPDDARPAGERYGEVKGYYFERRRATIPAAHRHPPDRGRRHRQRDRQGRRPAAASSATASRPSRDDPTKKRVLVVAAEDYTGVSPNVTAGYATAPRYLAQHVAALEAAGYEVETYNIDAPPANGGSPNPVVQPQIKYPTYLGVLSHFDAVNYYSGDDFVPQDATNTNPRRMTTRDRADRLPGDGPVGAPRRCSSCATTPTRAASCSSTAATCTSRSRPRAPACGDRPVHVDAGQAVRLLLPGQQRAATTTCRAPPGSARATLQRHVAELPRRRRSPVRRRRHRHDSSTRQPRITPGPPAGAVRRHGAVHASTPTAGNDPNQNADGTPLPLAEHARSPAQLGAPASERAAARRSAVEADYTTPRRSTRPRAARSSRRVTP